MILGLQTPDLAPREHSLEGNRMLALFVVSLSWFFGVSQKRGLPTALSPGTDNAMDPLSRLMKPEFLFRIIFSRHKIKSMVLERKKIYTEI